MIGCGKKEEVIEEEVKEQVEDIEQPAGEYKVDYGKSDIYTKEDMDKAIDAIMAEFDKWDGCVMKEIRFTDDKTCEDNLSYVNELGNGQKFDQAIIFMSDFHSPVDPGENTAWEADKDYNDYNWILGRAEGGDWVLLTWGY